MGWHSISRFRLYWLQTQRALQKQCASFLVIRGARCKLVLYLQEDVTAHSHAQVPTLLTNTWDSLLHSVGQQNAPSQNMPLWQRDYSELKASEKKQIQEKLSSPICLKTGHKCIKVSPLPLFQEGQKLTTRDNSRPWSVQSRHQRSPHRKSY